MIIEQHPILSYRVEPVDNYNLLLVPQLAQLRETLFFLERRTVFLTQKGQNISFCEKVTSLDQSFDKMGIQIVSEDIKLKLQSLHRCMTVMPILKYFTPTTN